MHTAQVSVDPLSLEVRLPAPVSVSYPIIFSAFCDESELMRLPNHEKSNRPLYMGHFTGFEDRGPVKWTLSFAFRGWRPSVYFHIDIQDLEPLKVKSIIWFWAFGNRIFCKCVIWFFYFFLTFSNWRGNFGLFWPILACCVIHLSFVRVGVASAVISLHHKTYRSNRRSAPIHPATYILRCID